MPQETPEQIQAQRNLDDAVEAFFKVMNWEGFITGWMLVSHQHRLDPETGEVAVTAHPIIYMGGTMPDHVALGLAQTAQDIIRGIGRWGREE